MFAEVAAYVHLYTFFEVCTDMKERVSLSKTLFLDSNTIPVNSHTTCIPMQLSRIACLVKGNSPGYSPVLPLSVQLLNPG